MKRLLSALIIFLLTFSLFSCFEGEEKIIYVENVFLSEETLSLYHFEYLPTPSYENSRMDKDNPNILYLNMSDEAFDAYCTDVADYLLSREDIYNVGLQYDVTLFVGPLFIPMSYDVYIPLADNNSSLDDNNKFAFALQSELSSGWVTNGMKDAYEITIQRTIGELGGESPYQYNTYIKIDNAKGVYEPCAKEHNYGEALSYPVPNTDIVIDISYCVYCSSKTQNHYYASEDNNKYAIEIISGSNYLDAEWLRTYRANPTRYAGLQEEITILRKDDTKYKVTVNGFEIPIVYEEENYLIYGFIMPQCDIEIEIVAIEE